MQAPGNSTCTWQAHAGTGASTSAQRVAVSPPPTRTARLRAGVVGVVFSWSPDRRTWTNISHSKAPESHGTQPLATVPARFTPRQGLSIANTHATAHGAMQCKARAEAEGDQGRPHRAAWSARGFGFFLDALLPAARAWAIQAIHRPATRERKHVLPCCSLVRDFLSRHVGLTYLDQPESIRLI